MSRKKEPQSMQDMLLEMSASLRQTATAPTIVAYKPLPQQDRFHKSTTKGKLFIGGNRSGKTVGGGVEAVKRLTGRHERQDLPKPPVRGRAIGVDFIQGIEKIIIPEIKKWLPPSYLTNGSWDDSYDNKTRTLHLTNSSSLEFMSYEQELDKHAGTSRHFIWFDEEPPLPIFNENMLRLVDVDGDFWITMTPLIDMSWTFDRLYEPGRKGLLNGIEVFEVSTLENTYIKESALDRLTIGMDQSEKEARTKGTYINFSGLVYKQQFDPDKHVLDDIVESDDWPLYHATWTHFVGFDHGWRNPTAWLFGCVNSNEQLIIYDEMYESGVLVSEWAERYHQRLKELSLQPQYIAGDPSIQNKNAITGTSVHTEYAEYGVYISLADNDLLGGITRVQNRFKADKIFFTRRCEQTLWEVNRYRWDKYSSAKIAARRSQKETPLGKDNHAMDALRYLVVSRPAIVGEVDMPMRNVLNLPEASTVGHDYDWALSSPEEHNMQVDPYLGTEY